jgi:hypothetical protein
VFCSSVSMMALSGESVGRQARPPFPVRPQISFASACRAVARYVEL